MPEMGINLQLIIDIYIYIYIYFLIAPKLVNQP